MNLNQTAAEKTIKNQLVRAWGSHAGCPWKSDPDWETMCGRPVKRERGEAWLWLFGFFRSVGLSCQAQEWEVNSVNILLRILEVTLWSRQWTSIQNLIGYEGLVCFVFKYISVPFLFPDRIRFWSSCRFLFCHTATFYLKSSKCISWVLNLKCWTKAKALWKNALGFPWSNFCFSLCSGSRILTLKIFPKIMWFDYLGMARRWALEVPRSCC